YGAEGESLKPYQLHLREARLARSRRDFETERQENRKVLAILRSEAREKLYRYTGLAGRLDYDESSENKKSDKRLEELIGILLSGWNPGRPASGFHEINRRGFGVESHPRYQLLDKIASGSFA